MIKGGNMEIKYEMFVKDLITELLEYNFQKVKEYDEDMKMLQKRILELSCKADKIISALDEEEKKLIEEYLHEKNVLAVERNYISYIQGFGDCIRVLKTTKII